MEEFNYPIKYALMYIEEQTGWIQGDIELEREYSEVGYIISKVYVTGKTIHYLKDGSEKTDYQVVYPYNPETAERIVPSIDAYNEKCYNSKTTSQVFDNYYEALVKRNEMNESLRIEICKKHANTQSVFSALNDFDERLNRYLEYEKFILSKEEDMIVQNDKVKKIGK